ncbi:MAG: type VI secretion system-associated FHA domain protein TagH [Betaproteobacteria bacterium]
MLTITVLSFNGIPLEEPVAADFAEAGGTIGRAPDSTLVLPDPDRIISRAQAVVAWRDGSFHLRDQGTTVSVIVNGRPVGRGREVALNADDEVRIAGYVMRTAGPPVSDTPLEEGTTILRRGTLLSWSEDGTPLPEQRISTVIVPSPDATDSAIHAARAVAASAAHATPAAPASAMHTSPAEDPLLQALLRGAGVRELALPGGLTPHAMEELGLVMRETMRGMLDLLATRASAKQQVRADATTINAHANNPLKFAPDLDAALTHLMLPRGDGFMPPLQAVADACESLRAHQVGFVAGMRAALSAVLARFDPQQLEGRLTQTSIADSLVPGSHKAKLWNLYEEIYGQIANEAATDFHALIGAEFLRGYQGNNPPGAPSGGARR